MKEKAHDTTEAAAKEVAAAIKAAHEVVESAGQSVETALEASNSWLR